MKRIPIALTVISILLGVLAIIGLINAMCGEDSFLRTVANFSLVATLIAIVFYVYYTYLLAKQAWAPSAGFELIQNPLDKLTFLFRLYNFTKIPVRCWCKINLTYCGAPVAAKRFYAGESSFDLQPQSSGNGILEIEKILADNKITHAQLIEAAGQYEPRKLLYLKIEFWYTPYESNEIYRNPVQPYFYDFNRNVMVLDF